MPDPSNFDSKDEFIEACIEIRQEENPDESTDQSYAICISEWEEAHSLNRVKNEMRDSIAEKLKQNN